MTDKYRFKIGDHILWFDEDANQYLPGFITHISYTNPNGPLAKIQTPRKLHSIAFVHLADLRLQRPNDSKQIIHARAGHVEGPGLKKALLDRTPRPEPPADQLKQAYADILSAQLFRQPYREPVKNYAAMHRLEHTRSWFYLNGFSGETIEYLHVKRGEDVDDGWKIPPGGEAPPPLPLGKFVWWTRLAE